MPEPNQPYVNYYYGLALQDVYKDIFIYEKRYSGL